MVKRHKNFILTILRRDFDASFYKSTSKILIEAAIEVAGIENDIVKQMIADYEFEFDAKFKQ